MSSLPCGKALLQKKRSSSSLRAVCHNAKVGQISQSMTTSSLGSDLFPSLKRSEANSAILPAKLTASARAVSTISIQSSLISSGLTRNKRGVRQGAFLFFRATLSKAVPCDKVACYRDTYGNLHFTRENKDDCPKSSHVVQKRHFAPADDRKSLAYLSSGSRKRHADQGARERQADHWLR